MLGWLRRRFGSSPHTRFERGEPTPCDCACHHNPVIEHFAACCNACERCNRTFRAGLAKHRKTCQGTSAPAPGPRGLERFDVGEPTVCECVCHGDRRIQHYAACCRFCDRCQRGFTNGFAKHRESCQGSTVPSPSSSAR